MALGIGPVLLLSGFSYRRRFKGVLHQWKKSQLVIFTISTFIINFTLFVLACFFAAVYVGRLDNALIPTASADRAMYLALDMLLLLVGTSMSFVGIQYFFTQCITHQGIVLSVSPFSPSGIHMLRWAEIKDYYMHSDYPVTLYHFLTQNAEGQVQKTVVRIPFYALPRFEYLLQSYMDQQEQLRAHSRDMLKRLSRN